MWSVWLVFCDCGFHSVCPLMGKDKRLVEASWWERLTSREDFDFGKDWRQEGKGTTEDEMIGWHHQPDGHEFEQALGVDDKQGSLACCSPWSHRGGPSEWLNWTELRGIMLFSWINIFMTHPFFFYRSIVSQIAIKNSI